MKKVWKKIRDNSTITVWESKDHILSVQYEKEDMLWYTIVQDINEKELYGKDLSKRTGTHHSEVTKEKMSHSHTGKKMTFKNKEEWIRKSSESHKKLWQNAEYANKIKVAAKKNWENNNYREKVTKAILKGLIQRPTSLEKQMIDIINRNNLPYKYTGNGSVLIGYKNPDFTNTKGEKICIEVANTIHHNIDYPENELLILRSGDGNV